MGHAFGLSAKQRISPDIRRFHHIVLAHYRAHGRHALPWRSTSNPYRILVSEVMLQQTQVARVIPKYREFIKRFPNIRALARAPASDVLERWSGLGYNRRALYLHRAAERVMREYHGRIPRDPNALQTLSGIGLNTAGSIVAFAFDAPVAFIETNIRRAFIHHFFPRRRVVADAELLPLIEAALIGMRPREWYSALMDYGSALAHALPKTANPNRKSRTYSRQSTFAGSVRELRGKILHAILKRKKISAGELHRAFDDPRVPGIVVALCAEGILYQKRGLVRVSGA